MLDKLIVKNFRNHDSECINFMPGVNLIIGENACGKTSLLESIYFMSTSKSHRCLDIKDLIKYDESFFKVECKIISNRDITYEALVDKEGKRILKINKVVKNKNEINNNIKVVIFSPDDHQIIKGEPHRRRTYFDNILKQTNVEYNSLLGRYNKIVKQRNAMLKRIFYGEDNYASLEPWNDLLIEDGSKICRDRKNIIADLNKILADLEEPLFKVNKKVNIKYLTSFIDSDDKDLLKTEIVKIQGEEMRRKQTLIGPHRDDYCFDLNSKDSRYFASQGEQRLLILSLKNAEVEYIKNKSKERPVLLLDDVFSELDEDHQDNIARLLKKVDQSILTTTVNNYHEDIKDWNIIRLGQ